MKKMIFAFAMMALFVFGGLVVETASAQNSNNTMSKPGMSSMSRRHGRHRWRRRHMRRGRRHGKRHGNSNM